MSGTLSSLQSALSALRYQRVAIDNAASNVANVGVEGYSRRRVTGETIGAPSVPAMWSRYTGPDGGVKTAGVLRLSDSLLESRSRTENAKLSYLSTRATVLARVESGVGEPGDSGVSAALADFRATWDDLANDPSSTAARGQVIASGAAVADAFSAQAANITSEEATQRLTVQGHVNDVNTIAAELADTNRAINAGRLDGTDTSSLYDTRDLLAKKLTTITGGTATERADGGLDVSVGGVQLVDGMKAGTLAVASGINPDGSADGSPVSYEITLDATTTPLTQDLSGSLGASTELLNVTLPGYADDLATVAKDFADTVNALHTSGFDQDGAAGLDFFTYDPTDPAGSLSVAVTERQVVASSTSGTLDGSIADQLGASGDAERAYQQLVSGLGTQVSSAKRLTDTQQLLTTQVDTAKEQLSGVNLDEEMVDMVAAQRAYEAAARVMSTVDDVLDTLINRTGLVR
ncbi:flagellar hook-associated protein FlgK [Nocardioides sp. GY 10127]|uniref:flagellar hook-associated protein FlgK n=1 Tax=Nocardioides sp. GY 10127 TaxID=2569762 RepID=UPI0010A91120|nr:flagellar hook-associated protein FlgK [Nocardioides sp. GY 10127]TIC79023.1 flagellar hook-associated protein FlgK [Nocardioides sp. GY 10127]